MRTALAFQRTRQAADRTMMAIMRTALSLIGFGFTIFSFFSGLRQNPLFEDNIRPGAPGRFGLALVIIGVLLLALGIVTHIRYMRQLRRERAELLDAGLIDHADLYPPSLALLSAMLLLLIGLVAILSIMTRSGPFA